MRAHLLAINRRACHGAPRASPTIDVLVVVARAARATRRPARARRSGAVEIWEIANDSEMDHPFHLHGMSFQLLDADAQPIAPLAWKDTVNVPRESSVLVAVTIGPPGRWMFHCHILEHAERGMMGELEVAAP